MGVVTGGGGGGTAFNGGTITNPLVIDKQTGSADVLSVLGNDSSNPVGRAGLGLTRYGNLTLLSESGAGFLMVVALDNIANTYNLVEAGQDGITINLSDATNSTFKVRSRGSASRHLLRGGYNDSGEIVVGFAAGTVGFYGATGVALQTGVAVSAAAIHAALVNLGLITA